jgi:hypothetical protein
MIAALKPKKLVGLFFTTSTLFANQSCIFKNKNTTSQSNELIVSKLANKGHAYEVFSYKKGTEKGDLLARSQCEKSIFDEKKHLQFPELVTKENCVEDPTDIPFEAFQETFDTVLKELVAGSHADGLLKDAKNKIELKEMYESMLLEAQVHSDDAFTRAHNEQNSLEFEVEIQKLKQEILILSGGAKNTQELFEGIKKAWEYTLKHWVEGDLPFLVHSHIGFQNTGFLGFENTGFSDRFKLTSSLGLMGNAVSQAFSKTLQKLIDAGKAAPRVETDPLKMDWKTLLETHTLSVGLSKKDWPVEDSAQTLFIGDSKSINFLEDLSSETLTELEHLKKQKHPVCRAKVTSVIPKEFQKNEKPQHFNSGRYSTLIQLKLVQDFPMVNFARESEPTEAGTITSMLLHCGYLENYGILEVEKKKWSFGKPPLPKLNGVSILQDYVSTVYGGRTFDNVFKGQDLKRIFSENSLAFRKIESSRVLP